MHSSPSVNPSSCRCLSIGDDDVPSILAGALGSTEITGIDEIGKTSGILIVFQTVLQDGRIHDFDLGITSFFVDDRQYFLNVGNGKKEQDGNDTGFTAFISAAGGYSYFMQVKDFIFESM